MTSFLSAFFYDPLVQDENNIITINKTVPKDWKDYPALRASSLSGVKPPTNTILVKTGGNALQAIDRQALQQDSVVAVSVPWYGKPGQSMLVRVPSNNSTTNTNTSSTGANESRVVRTKIPFDVQAGSVFLVQLPPLVTNFNTHDKEAVYTGIPLDLGQLPKTVNTTNITNTPMVGSEEIPFASPVVVEQQQQQQQQLPNDLLLREEGEEVEMLTMEGNNHERRNRSPTTEEGKFLV